jgi:hypothetical protein
MMVQMRRSPSVLRLVACVWLAGSAACSGSGDAGDGIPATTAAVAPDSVDPGTAVLILSGAEHRFTVTCGVTTTTTAPGVNTVFDLQGTGTEGETLRALRQETQGATVTVTDTVTFIDGDRALEAQRAGFAGAYVDLRQDGVTAPLLTLDGDDVRVDGRFGPPGSTAASPPVVEGQLVATCPA